MRKSVDGATPARKRPKSAAEREGASPAPLPSNSAEGWKPAIDALAALVRCELPTASALAQMPPAQADTMTTQYAALGESMLRVLGNAFELHQMIDRAQMSPAESALGARRRPPLPDGVRAALSP